MNGREITAVAYDGAGREIGRRSLRSAGETTELRAEVEYRGRDLAFVRVRYTDADGVTKPLERGMLRVSSVTGGELLGFGCAAPYNPGSFVTGRPTPTTARRWPSCASAAAGPSAPARRSPSPRRRAA
ncbi:hypothetical protein [Bifidobacterium pullorum]|uniref:hypothetical protein n=1 Tax=Bifidobacterium pullorum TaxID=78448 RepID=UPI001EF67E33|nr:hypothetical protein [Bifidobacterium pullorum]